MSINTSNPTILPEHENTASTLGNFKSLLKTHLFKVAYTDK